MRAKRPPGITVLSLYYWLMATILLGLSAVAFKHPQVWTANYGAADQVFPVPRDPRLGPVVAILPGAYCLVMGLGFWSLQKWARLIVLVNTYYFFGRALIGFGLLSAIAPASARAVLAIPLLPLVLATRLILWWYLIGDRAKEAFGIAADEPE